MLKGKGHNKTNEKLDIYTGIADLEMYCYCYFSMAIGYFIVNIDLEG